MSPRVTRSSPKVNAIAEDATKSKKRKAGDELSLSSGTTSRFFANKAGDKSAVATTKTKTATTPTTSSKPKAGKKATPKSTKGKPPTTPTPIKSSSLIDTPLPKTPKSSYKIPTPLPKRSPPSNFLEIYSLVKELRNEKTAPVDHDGAEKLALFEDSDPKVYRYQTLIALMLSSQTKDIVVGNAMRAMQKTIQGGLTVQSVLALTNEELDRYIFSVGFHNNKTKYIMQASQILIDKHGGDIPDTYEGIISLPGVGPKMGYIVNSICWGRDEGIGVDTHMHRLFNIIGWVKSTTPEATRMQLEVRIVIYWWFLLSAMGNGIGGRRGGGRHAVNMLILDCCC